MFAILLGSSVASGDPVRGLGDTLIDHSDADVAMLRDRLADPVARCVLGAVYAARDDYPRASLYLEACDALGLDSSIATSVEEATAKVQRKLRAGTLSAMLVVTNPAGLIAETDALPGERFTTPATVWAKAGTYKVRVARTAHGLATSAIERPVTLAVRSRTSVIVVAAEVPRSEPRDGKVDFNDEPTDPPEVGPPPAVKHPSMLPCKYEGCDTHPGEELMDPFALADDWGPPHPAAWRIGVRAGVDAAGHDGGSRIGPSFAIVLHHAVPGQLVAAHHPWELELRLLDFSERGGSDAKLDVLGTSLGLDRVIADPHAGWISVGLAVRGEARFGDMMGVDRYGVGAAASVELALRTLPVTLGAVYQQGLTELEAGTREHVFLVELGADWRVFTTR